MPVARRRDYLILNAYRRITAWSRPSIVVVRVYPKSKGCTVQFEVARGFRLLKTYGPGKMTLWSRKYRRTSPSWGIGLRLTCRHSLS
jgi:hypothetical protein